MNFLRDLFRWFVWGERRKNVPSSQREIEQAAPVVAAVETEIPEVTEPAVKPSQESTTFDFLKENPTSDFLVDLKSIRPIAEQFDKAREDLLRELQRLAPPKKRIFDIFRKAA